MIRQLTAEYGGGVTIAQPVARNRSGNGWACVMRRQEASAPRFPSHGAESKTPRRVTREEVV